MLFVDMRSRPGHEAWSWHGPVTGLPKAGSSKRLFEAPADFKAPLEELREYVE